MTIIGEPKSDFWTTFFAKAPNEKIQKLSKSFYATDNWDEFWNDWDSLVMEAGTHVVISHTMDAAPGRYRAKGTIPGVFPYTGFLTNKKWLFNEASKLSTNK